MDLDFGNPNYLISVLFSYKISNCSSIYLYSAFKNMFKYAFGIRNTLRKKIYRLGNCTTLKTFIWTLCTHEFLSSTPSLVRSLIHSQMFYLDKWFKWHASSLSLSLSVNSINAQPFKLQMESHFELSWRHTRSVVVGVIKITLLGPRIFKQFLNGIQNKNCCARIFTKKRSVSSRCFSVVYLSVYLSVSLLGSSKFIRYAFMCQPTCTERRK